MEIYQKSGAYNTLDEYIQAKTGKTIRGLNRTKSSYVVKNLDIVADRLKRAAAERQKIFVYGDYDTDGITSVSEMAILLKAIGADFLLYCPRRFSDGYGINVRTVGMVPDGALLVTVDNGISALAALEEAKKRNIEIIVLDHHMATVADETHIFLPPADIIVDPEALPEGNDFDGYCGAGIVCELARLMLTPGSFPLEYIKALAAIGTVADVVPLLSANRKIVKEGLANINAGVMPMGLATFIQQIRQKSSINGPLNSEHLGFYVSPCCNAAGRMVDTGAMGVVATILADNPDVARRYSTQLIGWNEQRKSITEDSLSHVAIDETDTINFVSGDIPAGCLGLVASKLAEKTCKPSFVMNHSNGVYKGSARSNCPENNIKVMLDSCKDLLLNYGGHAEAAGFSLKEENFDAVHSKLSAYPLVEVEAVPMYDLDIDPFQVPAMMADLDSVEPFGKGVERPVFRMKVNLPDGAVNIVKDINLRFRIQGNITGMAFRMAERYIADGCPKSIYLIGDLKWNYFRNSQTPQMIISDYEIA